jgi:phosphoglucosamine mutase
VEHAIEGDIFRLLSGDLEPTTSPLEVDPGLDEQYLSYLVGTFPHRLDGLHLVVDCANGAAVHLAPMLLERLGARVSPIGCAPDGRNINKNCGALHLEQLQAAVTAAGADAGIAFDGDADRCMFVSHSGKVVDGDAMLLITGVSAHEAGELTDGDGVPTIVATVMSNMGFEVALKKRGIRMLRTGVGDKYVLEEMIRRGAWVGGEQSGHVIFRRYATTGDGMLTALRVLEVMRRSGRDLDALTEELRVFPQELINIRVKEKRPIEELAGVQSEIEAAMQAFNGNGRVLVRYSGTESLARVMVEGPEAEPVSLHASRIAEAMKRELGA